MGPGQVNARRRQRFEPALRGVGGRTVPLGLARGRRRADHRLQQAAWRELDHSRHPMGRHAPPAGYRFFEIICSRGDAARERSHLTPDATLRPIQFTLCAARRGHHAALRARLRA